jgi:hypothetical protein
VRTLIASLLLIVAVFANQGAPSKQSAGKYNLSRTVPGPIGDEWVSWNSDMQAQYIRGYYEGYQRGDRVGCGDTIAFFVAKGVQTSMAMPAEPAGNCLKVKLQWSDSNESYAEKISQYYQTYLTDHDIPVPLLMEELSDQKHMSFVQIHQWYITGKEEKNP